MTPFELEKTLINIKVTDDTREQATTALADRLSDIGFEYERKKLDFGDYSCKVTLPDDTEIDFSTKFAIERKLNIAEMLRKEIVLRQSATAGPLMLLLISSKDWCKNELPTNIRPKGE